MGKSLIHQGFITGQLLVAMPSMRDPRFTRTVIYICAHTTDGAMGLVINRLVGSLSFPDLLDQLGIPTTPASEHIRIRNGGPVETGRGFVLHSSDYREDATLPVGDAVGLTATLDILRDIAAGHGPKRSLLALGYAGWGPGQLEEELERGSWLLADASAALVFDTPLEERYQQALALLGLTPHTVWMDPISE